MISNICKGVVGKYCLNNVLTDCPLGTICLEDNMNEPVDCPNGYYCEKPDTPPKICPPGYFCPLNCNDALQENYCPINNQAYICPPGSYCPGTGNYRITICPTGYYCPNSGMSAPTKCDTKYSCNFQGLKIQV